MAGLLEPARELGELEIPQNAGRAGQPELAELGEPPRRVQKSHFRRMAGGPGHDPLAHKLKAIYYTGFSEFLPNHEESIAQKRLKLRMAKWRTQRPGKALKKGEKAKVKEVTKTTTD